MAAMERDRQTATYFYDRISMAMQGRGLETDRIVKQMLIVYTYCSEVLEFNIDIKPVLKELPVTLTPIEEWARTHPVPGWPYIKVKRSDSCLSISLPGLLMPICHLPYIQIIQRRLKARRLQTNLL